jgi:hypothetical protein
VVSATALVTFSDVEGGFTGTGNINLVPQFADTSFLLSAISPCIDSGDSNVAYNDPPDPNSPAQARWPARGMLRNDMGAYGGPFSSLLALSPTSVDERRENSLPQSVRLFPNFPNPFNPTTRIAYSVLMNQHITMKVYDLLGKEVVTLVDGVQQTGMHYALFGGDDLAGGVYLVKIFSGAGIQTGKMLLVK